MKQHLIPDDLKLLTDTGKERLSGWWKPELDHIVAHKDYDQGVPLYILVDEDMRSGWSFEQAMEDVKVIPLLSIGQLIQFLDEHNVDWVNELFWVSGGDTPFPQICKGYGFVELIDALWKAAVDILNKE